MYPMLENNVCLMSETDEDTGHVRYFATNKAGDEYELSRKVFCELYDADGTHAVNLPQKTISRLEERGLLRTKRLVNDGFNKHIILLAMGEKRSRKLRPLATCCYKTHRALLIVMPVLACVMSALTNFNVTALNLGIAIALLFLSEYLHEFGHMIAALNFGTVVGSLGGTLVGGFLPLGAYVAINEAVLTDKEKVKTTLAGVQVNFILACIFLTLRYFMPDIAFTLFFAAASNGVIVLENLIPNKGNDGEQFLSTVFGVEDVGKYADKVFRSKKRRNRIRQRGLIGWISLVILFGVHIRKVLRFALLFFGIAIWFWIL